MFVKNSCNIIIVLYEAKILGRVAAWGTDCNNCNKHTLSINHRNPELVCKMLESCSIPSKVKCIVHSVVGGKGVTRCSTGFIEHYSPHAIRISLTDNEDKTYKPSESDLSWLMEGI